jgi:NAD(P)-dependent dehydrogenase (short-subunit alcohol dehydrogenase family)
MNKSVLITGSSGLIGTQLCREFIEKKYRVFGVDLKDTQKIRHEAFTFLKCDLSSAQEIASLTQSVKELNVLINNAARTDLTFKKFDDMSLDDWEKGIAVNLTSVFLLAKTFMPHLRKSKGNIINISSTRHLQSEENTEIYSASKGGVFSLTHAMAMTQKHCVRVNCISPGWIEDPAANLKQSDHDQHPVGRVGKPSDVSALAAFLASDEASFITGQDFIVDGGMSKKMIYC